MDLVALLEHSRKLCTRYRIEDGSKFRLQDIAPDDIANLKKGDKDKAEQALTAGIDLLTRLQEKLYAQHQWSVLLIFQATDAAGKDGAIKHVMSGVNPQGCDVHSFKQPTSEELSHDYLWRYSRHLPARGHIGIFNRSYYENVLVERVHPEFLAQENMPAAAVDKKIWHRRYREINDFEHRLTSNGYVILKFFLHLSKEEQKKRFLARLDDPDKMWKFSPGDIAERARWDDYQHAYEKMIRVTATKRAPWHVIPADHKWFSRVAVAASIIHALDGLDLAYPAVSKDRLGELAKAREALMQE